MDRRTFLKSLASTAAVAGAGRWAPAEAGAGTGAAPAPDRLTLMGAGDCIITRRVSGLSDPDFLALVELLRGADCVWGNCEIVIGKAGDLYPGLKGGDPHVIGDPFTADELRWMGFKIMGTANNHAVDYGLEGLASTLESLDRVGIAHAGTGADLEHASRPGFFDGAAGRVGLVSCASTYPPYFAAAPAHPHVKGRPGVNPLAVKSTVVLDDPTFQRLKAARQVLGELWAENDYLELGPPPPKPDPKRFDLADLTIATGEHVDLASEAEANDVKRIVEAIKLARRSSRLVIASIHAHEARRKLEISDVFIQPFARACIDAGAGVYFSSGPHVLRGIEIYKGKPIFYSLSNFFFQLETMGAVPAEDFAAEELDRRTLDPLAFEDKVGFSKQQRFWQSVVPRITYEGDRVAEIELFPLTLGWREPVYRRGTPRLARGEEAAVILKRLADLSAPYGTVVEIIGDTGRVRLG